MRPALEGSASALGRAQFDPLQLAEFRRILRGFSETAFSLRPVCFILMNPGALAQADTERSVSCTNAVQSCGSSSCDPRRSSRGAMLRPLVR